jgi:hypothetical protein
VLDPTVIVIVELPPPGAAIVLGLKLTVVPLGAPLAVRLIALLNPPPTVVVIVEVPELPCATLTDVGKPVSVKLAAAVTVRATVALCWVSPPLASTVIGYVPTAVLEPTAIVIVELPPPGAAIVLGLKLTVVPLGAPAAVRLIALLKPPLTVVVTVEVAELPCATLTEVGESVSVKLLGAVTVRATVVLCWVPPPVPVTVIG